MVTPGHAKTEPLFHEKMLTEPFHSSHNIPPQQFFRSGTSKHETESGQKMNLKIEINLNTWLRFSLKK